MRKLTFERAVLAVFILIILISTSDTTLKGLDKIINRFKASKAPIASTNTGKSLGFSTLLMNADNLYKAGDFEGAADEYFKMTLNSTLSPDQKVHAYFRLGICQNNLKKYDLAIDSFNKVTSFNSGDSLAYNNAAVCAYRNKNVKMAIELQRKALDLLPAVEYYYNLARMYEDSGEYELAANNYLIVAIAEQNLTKIEKIDPVRVKEKVARLTPTDTASASETAGSVRALKLEDNRDIFTVNENEMQIKQGDFIVKVENQKTSKNIVAEYDKVKYDPYHLISELIWTIYKDGKAIYKKSSDKISFNTMDAGNYEVKLNIKYNGNKEMASRKTVTINPSNSSIGNAVKDDTKVSVPVKINTKTYEYALYEQLFESDFEVSSTGYTDKYNVIWGKDGVAAGISKQTSLDKASSLFVGNTTYKTKGIWAVFDSLLQEEKNKDKNVTISFYAKKISPNASINLMIRLKSNNVITLVPKSFILNSEWEQKSVSVFIPKDATGFTMTLTTSPGEEFVIDRFVIVD